MCAQGIDVLDHQRVLDDRDQQRLHVVALRVGVQVALCKFLTTLRFTRAQQIAADRASPWRAAADSLNDERRALVAGIAKGNVAQSRARALTYHERAVRVIAALG